jgi:hypothetical protein
MESIAPIRNVSCLRILSTSIYELSETLVNSNFSPASLITYILQLFFGLSLFLAVKVPKVTVSQQ